MSTLFRSRLLLVLGMLAPVMLALQLAEVGAQAQSARPPRSASPFETQKERMNAWTVGLAGGLLEGASPPRSPASSTTGRTCLYCPS